MNRKPLLIAATAAAALLTLSACNDTGGDNGTTDNGAAAETTTAVEETTADTEAEAAEHNDADVMFAQMMIPHHEQAIEMSEIILATDGVPEQVTTLAEEIMAAQGPEIEQLTDWLEQWGEPTDPGDGHDMADMDGMLSDEELQQLADAQGDEAARLFLEQMIVHHEGAVAMAEDQLADGSYQPALELAQTIIDTQQEEIDTMNELLDTL